MQNRNRKTEKTITQGTQRFTLFGHRLTSMGGIEEKFHQQNREITKIEQRQYHKPNTPKEGFHHKHVTRET